MTITISDDLEPFVRAKMQTGAFENPEAVVAAALTAWQGEEALHSMDRNEVEGLLLEAIDSPRFSWSEVAVDRIVDDLRARYGAS